MNASLIVEMWDLFKDYTDKKHQPVIAEKYVQLVTDHGASDRDLQNVLGHDDDLDDDDFEDIDSIDVDDDDDDLDSDLDDLDDDEEDEEDDDDDL